MEFLYFLEGIRLPGLNEFMLAVTYLGDEIAFLVTALILFWCVSSYTCIIVFVSTAIFAFPFKV